MRRGWRVKSPQMQRRILIIEDDADIREALADAMRDAGAEVVVAADGVDGLARLRDGARPVVILLDLRMPRLGGEEFLREMRADPRFEHIPVITMTAGSSVAEGTDIVARLHKPFDVDDLRQIVESLFDVAA
ncbi:MAG TPA: response regulator [Anaeromyxobacter sp.]